MFPNAKTLLVIVSCALVAQAQSTESSTTTTAPASQSSVPAVDDCILNCVTNAATTAGCSSFTDLTCVCTSMTFQDAATACLQANCTADDLTAATQLQQQECATLSSTAASSATSSSASASATNTSAAMTLSVPFSFGSIVGTLVASAGALVGAAFVL